MQRLEGKVALVTGGARGIGRAIAEAFAREGAALVLVDLPGMTGTLATGFQTTGTQVLVLEADVSDEEAVQGMVAAALVRFGQVDILVNNAGITQRLPFVEMRAADWDRMMTVNLRSVFLVTRAVVPAMLAAGGGRIINIASQLGQRGAPLLTHYCATKAGIIGFTKALARELAPTITVNAIAPGPILTDLVRNREPSWFEQIERELPLGRLGLPEEVAPTAIFLASDDGALYTGQTLGPNSGHVML